MIEDDKTKLARPSEPDPIADDRQAAQASERDLTKTAIPAGDKAAATDVQSYIGRQLRAVYDDVAKQPVPERFLALMKQLEEQTFKK